MSYATKPEYKKYNVRGGGGVILVLTRTQYSGVGGANFGTYMDPSFVSNGLIYNKLAMVQVMA